MASCKWLEAVIKNERLGRGERCGCKPLNPTLTPNGFTAGLKDSKCRHHLAEIHFSHIQTILRPSAAQATLISSKV